MKYFEEKHRTGGVLSSHTQIVFLVLLLLLLLLFYIVYVTYRKKIKNVLKLYIYTCNLHDIDMDISEVRARHLLFKKKEYLLGGAFSGVALVRSSHYGWFHSPPAAHPT